MENLIETMNKFGKQTALCTLILFATQSGVAEELVIGEELVEPGIQIIFEGAVKDAITPPDYHLEESKTHVHIEARVNWAEDDIPEGTPPGGFVGYLIITAQVINPKTGAIANVDLLPHINLVDNLHYARNMALPGEITDKYDVVFNVMPPAEYTLSYHRDWVDGYGDKLFEKRSFMYKGVDFEAIARATR